MRRIYLAVALAMLTTSCAGINTEALNQILNDPLDEETVAAGLKEALEVGTDRTVGNTSSVDGFLGNALIRIAIPEEFNNVANTLRTAGFGSHVDRFEVAMNRAAERASGEARSVFWNQIKKMTLADAFGILNGHETAATEYFQTRTTAELRSRFMPIVQNKMSEAGVYNTYNQLVEYYTALPFVSKPALDLDSYITDGTLDGLFTVLGEEEAQIRKDPAARTTALLKRVFGSRTGS